MIDDSIMELEDYQAERALAKAALDAIERAARFGTDFVVEENGKTISLRPHETGQYKLRFLEDLERVNKKIAEMQAENPNVLTLNDKPKQ